LPEFGFALGIGSGASDTGHSVVSDELGNAYVTGRVGGAAIVNKYTPDDVLAWNSAVGGASEGWDIDVTQDRVYAVAYSGTHTRLAKLNRETGVSDWNFSISDTPTTPGDPWLPLANNISVDSDGNIYVAGYLYGDAVFQSREDSHTVSVSADKGAFLAKYDSNGDLLWATGLGNADAGASGLAVDSVGNVIVSGFHTWTGFTAKYDAAGVESWRHELSSTADVAAGAIAIDSQDNVLVQSLFSGTVDFDPANSHLDDTRTSTGSLDVATFKLSGSGEFQWVRTIGGTEYDGNGGIAVDSTDNVYVGGFFKNTVSFEGSSETFTAESTQWDAFLSSYDNDGNFAWARDMGGAGDDRVYSVAVRLDLDAQDNRLDVYATGPFTSNPADFDRSAVHVGDPDLVPNSGGEDMYLAQYTRSSVVTHTSDGGPGSLRDGIIYTNAIPGDDTIYLGAGTYALTIGGDNENAAVTGDLDVTENLTIVGAGADQTFIDASGLDDRLFDVPVGVTLEISGVTLTGGDVSVDPTPQGGAIRNAGTVRIAGSSLEHNTGGTWSGGAIYNQQHGLVEITDSTLHGNQTVYDGGGGAIFNNGTGAVLTIVNSTLSNNEANVSAGGAIYNNGPGTVTITNSTLTDNRSLNNDGGGIYTEGTLTLKNTIVSGNTGGPDIRDKGTLNDLGHNVVGPNLNLHLGPLQDNGGPTLTHALLLGSTAAIDAGDNSVALPVDQRGYARIVDGDGDGTATIDIGAYEAEPPDTSVGLDAFNNLLVEDTNGADTEDTLAVVISGLNVRVTDSNNALAAGAGATQVDEHTVDVPIASITGGTGIIVNTLGGDDTLTVDFSGGDFSKSITYNGGETGEASGDELKLQGGGTFADATYTFSNVGGGDPDNGTIDITDNALITYTGLEPIASTITATNVTLNYSTAAETITVTNPGGGQTTVDSTAGETTTFNNPTGTLTINAGDAGDDVIDVQALGSGFAADVIINGQGGTDTVTWNTTQTIGSLTVDAEAINLDSGQVNTIGDQTYNGAVMLGANTTVAGANVTFNGTVDGDALGGGSGSDGSLDASFGTGGKVATDFMGAMENGNSMVLQTDGKILVG